MAEPTTYQDRFASNTTLAPVAPPPAAGDAMQEQYARKQATSNPEQLGAMFRQDNSLDGLVAWWVGRDFLPEPGYNAARDEKQWKSLTEGVHPQYHHEFTSAVSPAHAYYIKDRLLQKQKDLQTLGDLDSWGNAGRFGFGLLHGMIDPINVPTIAMGTPLSVAGKIGAGALGGAAQEAVRQRVNFENAPDQVLDAALTAGAFSAPFALLGSLGKASADVANTALSEKRALNGEVPPKDMQATKDLISAEQRALNDEAFDHAEQLAAIRKEAELAHMDQLLSGDGPDVNLGSDTRSDLQKRKHAAQGGDTPVDVLLNDHKANADFPQKTAMELALEKAGLLEQDRVKRAADAEAAAAAKRTADAAAKTAADEAKWADFFKQAEQDGMLSVSKDTEGKPADASRSPRPLQEVAAELPLLDKLNATVQSVIAGGKAAFDARPVLHLDAGLAALAKGFGERFGRRIVFFRDAAGNKVKGTFVRSIGDTLFVRADHPRIAEVVAMHEFFHSLRTADPARYAQFVDGVKNAVKNFDQYKAEFEKLYSGQGIKLPSLDKINEEFLADLVEKLVRDDKFHELMQRREGGMLRQMVANILDWIGNFVDKLTGNTGGLPADAHLAEYVSDLNRFRRELAKFVSNAHAASGAADEGGVLFSAVNKAMASPVIPKGAATTARMEKARWDYSATIMKGSNEKLKELALKMMRDPLGKQQGWTASEWATKLIRQFSFPAHAEMQVQFEQAAHTLGWNWLKRNMDNSSFYEAVARVKRGDETDILPGGKFEAVAQNVRAAAAAADKAYAGLAKELQDAGVQGAAGITPDPKYVNRVWRQDRIKEAINKWGQGPVIQALADSFTDPALKGDVAKAEQFLRAVLRLEYSPALRDMALYGHDMKRLRFELEKAGLSASDADTLVEVMLGQKKQTPDAGNPTNLRFRMGIDESYQHPLNSNGDVLRITDLFENDIRVLMDTYVRAMSGHAGMAKVGIKSAADFEAFLTAAREEHETGEGLMATDSAEFNRSVQHMRDVYDVLTGRPMAQQSFNRFDRIMAGLRGLTRSAMLGQLGVAQALELTNAMAITGLQSVMHHSPSFAALIKQAKEGRIADDALQQFFEHEFGTGLEMAATYVRNNEVADFSYHSGPANNWLDRAANGIERAGNRASHAIDVVSGNRLMTSYTRSLATRWAVQQFVDFAHGKTALNVERLKDLGGFTEADIKPFMADLKAYAKVDSKGTVVEIDWENWQVNNPKTYDQFTLSTMRRVRDAIQDHDIGETMPWMHTTVGKIFSELRTFMLVAHVKQFLKNVHYRDAEALQLFTVSLVAQAAGYIVQASANNAGSPDKLDKALEPDRIAKAAVQRMSVTGLLPMLFESGYWVASGGNSFFQGGSFNTDSRNFLMTPSMTMATRVADAGKVVGGAMNPWSDAVRTQKEMRSLYGLLPGSNTYLMRNVINALVEDLPKSEPMKRPQ